MSSQIFNIDYLYIIFVYLYLSKIMLKYTYISIISCRGNRNRLAWNCYQFMSSSKIMHGNLR